MSKKSTRFWRKKKNKSIVLAIKTMGDRGQQVEKIKNHKTPLSGFIISTMSHVINSEVAAHKVRESQHFIQFE